MNKQKLRELAEKATPDQWNEICSKNADVCWLILALLDENAALLEALRDLRDFYEELTNLPACKANSAIAKAESS